ncbi:4Fe-4S dicluster domain-containing protein [Campylobacter sp. MG1]|uniref:4Fe-4S dicluster domain-containing protein n=1 Tax=Campylobacter sp. MG1 TaxID=2976332 RepID=UPI00226D3D3E|nr:4Fe-4S dicluster domain-containing protein [Campylobacter sp. MG1]
MGKIHDYVICNPSLCIACKACEKACIKSAYKRGKLDKNRLIVLELDNMHMPNQCRQCDDAPCANVCPTATLQLKNGIVSLSENTCIGCKLCTIACPYGAIRIDAENIPSIKENNSDSLGYESVIGRKSIAVKCDTCAGNPACVDICPKGALIFIKSNKEHVFGKKLKVDVSDFIAKLGGQ